MNLDLNDPKVLRSLKGLASPEARGNFLYAWARQNAENDSATIPEQLKTGAEYAIDMAFGEGDFRSGFLIARQTGKSEELTRKLTATPTQVPNITERLPPEVTSLPGYHKRWDSDFNRYNRSTILSWVSTIKSAMVREVLVPEKRYDEAVTVLSGLGERDEAANIALRFLAAEKAVEVCERENAGFREGVKLMRQTGRRDLEERLEQAHVVAAKNGVLSPYQGGGNKHYRWTNALEIANGYHFPDETTTALASEGVEALTSEFGETLKGWRMRLDHEELQRHYFWDDGGDTRKKIEAIHSERENSDSVTEVEQIVSLLKTAAKGKPDDIEKKRNDLYSICTANRSLMDQFKVALAFDDSETITDLGFNHCSLHSKSYDPNLDNWALGQVGQRLDPKKPDVIKRYIHALGGRNGQWGTDYQTSIASKFGLRDWFLDEVVEHSPANAPHIALSFGLTDKARELFTKLKVYDEALKLTNNPAERTRIHLLKTERTIEEIANARRQPMFSLRACIGQTLTGLEELERSVDDARRYLPAEEYQKGVINVVGGLLNHGVRDIALLFAEAHEIDTSQLHSASLQSTLLAAEREGDFVGGYYAAKAMGSRDSMTTYQVLARNAGQKIFPDLKAYKASMTRQKARLDKQAKREEDDVPF